MGIIRQLPEDIAIKIAAGEVVERPASAVKELVENALDAGATHITIDLEAGGKNKIIIQDDGSGMDRDDAERAFLRHGTSKIQSLDDLMQLVTLGFRGEALAAIGASAEVELVTALEAADSGTRVIIRYGTIESIKPHAPRKGTTITVSNLFHALPARQKFLKTDATEWKTSLDVIVAQMLCHPTCAFTVRHNGKIIYDVSSGSFPERVAAIWRLDPDRFIEINMVIPHLELRGVIGKPEIAHETKGRQFLSVNGHPVQDKMIARSVKDAFGTLLPPGLYPVYALNLVVHPGMVDVNIHPRKEEVRFINPQEIFRFIRAALSQALDQEKHAFQSIHSLGITEHSISEKPVFGARSGLGLSAPSSAHVSSAEPTKHALPFVMPSPTSIPPSLEAPLSMPEATPLEPIFVVDNCFLVTCYEGKLLLIDQHAAHERILYNQLWRDHRAHKVSHQDLLVPEPLGLNEAEKALVLDHEAELRALGFEWEDDLLKAVPVIGHRKNPRAFFTTIVHSLEDDRPEPELTTPLHKRFAMMACKAAVKAGDVLLEAEKHALVRDSLGLDGGFTCPHGRPTYIEISGSELEKLFKRTGF